MEGREKKTNARRFHVLILKLCVSIGLLIYVIVVTDFSVVFALLYKINTTFLLLSIILICFEKITTSYRWYLLIASVGYHARFLEILRIYLVCGSLGSFTPGGIGTEVLKVYSISSNLNDISSVTSSIVADRFLGFVSLLIISFCCTLFLSRTFVGMEDVMLISVMFLILFLILFLGVTNRKLIDSLESFSYYRLTGKVFEVFKKIMDFSNKKFLLLNCLLLSVMVQLLRILIVYFFALAIGIYVQAIYFFIFVPIIFFIKQLPISINGIGLSQGLYLWLFGRIGMSAAEAFTLSTGVMILGYLAILVGGILYMTHGISLARKIEQISISKSRNA